MALNREPHLSYARPRHLMRSVIRQLTPDTRSLSYCPCPDRFTITCDAFPLSPMDSVPFTNPTAVGVNVTLIVQLAPGASELPQLLLCV